MLLAGLFAATAGHASETPTHGLSVFGVLKYAPDFKHFDYVNPDAPKGGRMSSIGTIARNSFDSFNNYIRKGDAAQGLTYLFDSLMARAADEPDAMYGLVAHSAAVAADRASVVFQLRREVRFADGSALTAADVVFTFDVLKEKGHPNIQVQLKDVSKAEALDEHTVRYTFAGGLTRDLPLVVAGLPIFSKAFYTAREFEETTLEPPLGSGPYMIDSFRQGTFVSYKRREDYWAKDLPVNRGRFNFGELRFEYYRDRTAELESLIAGAFDLREEFTALHWMTGYDVPAAKDGRLIKLVLPDQSPSAAQGYFLNARQPKFADVRVRKAFDYAFDFEFTNKTIFYDLYTRTESFFENSEMKASGKPSPEELALLEPFRAKLPAEVFGEIYKSPVSDGSGKDRNLRREASRLLDEAGWKLVGGKRVNDKGESFQVEFLIADPTAARILTHYAETLQLLGINASVRRVDPAQYERRVKAFDFDVIGMRYALRPTPGPELRNYWGSDSAKTEASANLAGISDPVIDALIGRILDSKKREELVIATRALDRVLRAGHYWVPHWFKAAHHVVHWDKFSRPETKPRYERGITDTWWYDPQKAAKLKPN